MRDDGVERDEFARRIPARGKILALAFGAEQRRGVGAAQGAKQRKRHGAKAAVAARRGHMDKPAARGFIGADRQARRRLHRKFEHQHVGITACEGEACARGVERKCLAGDKRARRGRRARAGGGSSKAPRLFGRADRDAVDANHRVAGRKDADERSAGNEGRRSFPLDRRGFERT